MYGRHLVWLGHGGFDLAGGGRHSTGWFARRERSGERESEKLEERIRYGARKRKIPKNVDG